jgi:hypothetical protein
MELAKSLNPVLLLRQPLKEVRVDLCTDGSWKHSVMDSNNCDDTNYRFVELTTQAHNMMY